jgi:FAD-linked oxidoreductase
VGPRLGARQSIAGATSTSTHGTGANLAGIANFIVGLELVVGDGSVHWCDADHNPELFHCARVGLGALGVVTKVTLQCVPAFNLRAYEHPERLASVLDGLPERAQAHDHFEFYWFPHTDRCLVKENDRTEEPVRARSRGKAFAEDVLLSNYALGAVCAVGKRVPAAVPTLAEFTAKQVGILDVVDRSYRIFCSPRLVRFVEMEYAIPRAHVTDALLAVRDMIEREGYRVSFPIEVRVAAADDIPLSTGSGRDSAYIAVHMAKGVPFEAYFRSVEAIMDGFEGRPHWGKMHYQSAATLADRYPEWERFQAARRACDPEGTFTNAYLDRVLG